MRQVRQQVTHSHHHTDHSIATVTAMVYKTKQNNDVMLTLALKHTRYCTRSIQYPKYPDPLFEAEIC